MIYASLLRLGLAALGLLAIVGPAFAQQQPAQRSGTTTRPPQTQPAQQQTQPTQQRGATSAAPRSTTPAVQQKPNGAAAKPTPGTQAKPAPGTQAKPTPGAQTKPAAPGPGGTQGVLLGTYRDWQAYTSGQGRSRICYALSEPLERLPTELKRDKGYLFVSFRPADNVRNEIAVVMGFAAREGGPAEATVGSTSYELVTKGANAWIKNQTEENKVVNSMVRAQTLIVKVTSGRGNPTTDRYSLSGFSEALDRARKECS
jgi:hypothetical protein